MLTVLNPHRYVIEVLESRIAPATFVVTTVNDSGLGSLRQAILDANAREGLDLVSFEIPGENLQIISLLSALPTITDVVALSTVPFNSQTGEKSELVRIDGANAGAGVDGLKLEGVKANGSRIGGLELANFSGSGLVLEGVSRGDIVYNRLTGNEVHGLLARGGSSGTGWLDIWGNQVDGNGEDGLRLENVTSRVGNDYGGFPDGNGKRLGNIVEENGLYGVRVVGGTAGISGNVIQSNGSLSTPESAGGGIVAENTTWTRIGYRVELTFWGVPIVEGNSIVDNFGHGILITGAESTGVEMGGNQVLRNMGDGVRIDGASGTLVGYNTHGRGQHYSMYPVQFANEISGNAGWGVNAINQSWDTVVVPNHTMSENDLGDIFINEDSRPRASVSGATVLEGDLGVQTATFTVSLDRAYSEALKVSYRSVDGMAKAGEDFEGVEGVLEFAAGETTKTVVVTIYGDTLQEPSESFNFDIAGMSDSLVIAVRSTSGMVLNDDAIPTVSVHDVVVIEGDGANGGSSSTAVINVTLSNASLDPVTVTLGTLGGDFGSTTDYTTFSAMITFAPGVTSMAHSIVIANDSEQEAVESFLVGLSDPIGATIGDGAATLSIVDDDTWTIESDPLAIFEGSAGLTTAVMKLRLVNSLGISNHEHSIRVLVSPQVGGTANANDFSFAPTFVTFAPGQLEAVFSILVIGDNQAEQNETVLVRFSEPVGASLGSTSVAQLTILNDDPGAVYISPSSVIEGDKGEAMMVFQVGLSAPMIVPVSMSFRAMSGTASLGPDFLPVSGELIFAPGETQKTIAVPVYGDRLDEGNEVFMVQLTSETGIMFGIASATGTIIDDPTDRLRLTIGKNGRFATWVDSDGDIISLSSNRPVFSADRFEFGFESQGGSAILQRLVISPETGIAPSLRFSVDRSPTGDGLVNVGLIEAHGDMKKVTLPGWLGGVQAGDANFNTPGIAKLTVNSFGLRPFSEAADLPSLLSEIQGSLGAFKVRGDFLGANLVVSNGSVGLLKIGGDLRSDSEAAPSSIVIDGSLSRMVVGGDIHGVDALTPLEIRTAQGEAKKSAAGLGRLYVAGDVVNTDIRAEGNLAQRGARVGQILVDGDWRTSNLLVGAEKGVDGFAGTEDDVALQSALSRIARIRIDGSVFGTSNTENAEDHFGFVAGQIGAFQIAGQALPLSAKRLDVLQPSMTASDVLMRELARDL